MARFERTPLASEGCWGLQVAEKSPTVEGADKLTRSGLHVHVDYRTEMCPIIFLEPGPFFVGTNGPVVAKSFEGQSVKLAGSGSSTVLLQERRPA